MPIQFPNRTCTALATSTWRFAIVSITMPGVSNYMRYSIYRTDINSTSYTGSELFLVPIMLIGC